VKIRYDPLKQLNINSMNTRDLLFGFVAIALLMGCASDPLPLEPSVATLISPTNNETCLNGTSLNDTQSNVSFVWSAATNAVSYQLVVKNLITQSEQTFAASSPQQTAALNKEEPYSWKVTSIGEEGSTPVESEVWKFYLAGDEVINFAPFPPELIVPRSGATLTPNEDALITFRWTCSDVENDLLLYEIYLDTAEATTKVSEVDYEEATTEIELEVELNKTYRWRVIATDAQGNKSDSGVYGFRTN